MGVDDGAASTRRRTSVGRRSLALVIFAVHATCGTLRREISRDQIQAQVAAHFPVDRQQALWRVRLADPLVSLDEHANRAGMSFTFDVDGPGIHKQGRGHIEGTPDYREPEGAIYLTDATLDRLEIDGREHNHVRAAVEAAVTGMLRDHPIYRLSAERSGKEGRALKHLRRLFVEQGRLIVEYTL